MKLWQKNTALDRLVEEFTVGEDPQWDNILLPYDIRGSKAHCRMLCKTGLITAEQEGQLLDGLNRILEAWGKGEFTVTAADEDMHTAIENALTDMAGEAGKTIHTGRSRNDQVLTALRLYMKERAALIAEKIRDLQAAVRVLAERDGTVPIPGYTHTRKAMPSTVSDWAGALSLALEDDLQLLNTVLKILDKNPLGTGAGYGVPLPLDRKMTTEELGFAALHENPVHAQNSRGKYEGMLLNVCTQILADLNRMAADLIFYTVPGLDLFRLPDAFTTGSSIMPQKKNPDLLEILRGNYHAALSDELQVRNQTVSLISGYHRDIQGTKGVLIRSLERTLSSLELSAHLFRNLSVNTAACSEAMSPELYAAEEAYRLVTEKGMTFRDAYREIGKKYSGDAPVTSGGKHE